MMFRRLRGHYGLTNNTVPAWLSARTAIRPGLPGVKGRRLQLLTG